MKTFNKFIKEELNDRQKEIVSKWHRDPRAIEATDHFFGKGNDDVFEPLQNGVKKSEVHRAVERHLGQEIPLEDYKAGRASDKYGRPIRIGGLLQKTKASPDLINQFSNDSTRQLKSETNMKVRITRSPEGVAGQTSGTQSWVDQSCKNFDDGVHKAHLPHEVKNGTVVAYLHNEDGKELARATLHPYKNKAGDRIYLHNSYYGPSVKEFEDHVNDITSRLSTKKVSGDSYEIDPQVYNDGGPKIVLHPNATEEHISKALDDKNWRVRYAAIHHPNATKEHITKALGDEDYSVRRAAIEHPDVTEDHISKALGDKNWGVRRAAIERPNATRNHISKALGDEDYSVRRAAIERPNATRNHITKALNDEDASVRRAAIQHPNATKEHITKALDDDQGYIRTLAIQHPNATKEHISKALGDEELEVRRAAIQHPDVTEDHISKALGDEDYSVRRAAIERPNATRNHITKALNDEDASVRRAAIQHPNATKEHITKALDDDHWSVRRWAIKHPNATKDHITKALNDKESEVRDYAKERSKQLKESSENTHKKTFRQLRESRKKIHKINDFVSFACKHLDLEQPPEINYVNDKSHAFENRSFGSYHIGKNTINVNVAERHVADIIRTLAHEMVHYKQDIDGRLDGIEYAGETGSTFENEANSEAGVMLRNYGRANPHIYEAAIKLGGASDGAKNFMDELYATTEAHPWNPRIRIINGNVTVEASKMGNNIHLHDIVSHAPRSGAGTKALNHLKSLADKHGVELEGVAKAYTDEGGRISSSDRLKKWYTKNGFTASYGNAEDGYDISYKP